MATPRTLYRACWASRSATFRARTKKRKRACFPLECRPFAPTTCSIYFESTEAAPQQAKKPVDWDAAIEKGIEPSIALFDKIGQARPSLGVAHGRVRRSEAVIGHALDV